MIPKVFHRIWVGSDMPTEFVEYGRQWQELHPGWQLLDWNEDTFPELVNQDLVDRAERIAPRNIGQFVADVVRLELLYQVGGVYIDCDMEPRRCIEPLLDSAQVPNGLFAAWEVDWVWMNNAIMGARAEHPFLLTLIERLPESVRRRPHSKPNVMSGPQFLTREVNRARAPMTVFESKLFYPYLWSELDRADEDFPDAYAVHRWNNRRKARSAGRAGV